MPFLRAVKLIRFITRTTVGFLQVITIRFTVRPQMFMLHSLIPRPTQLLISWYCNDEKLGGAWERGYMLHAILSCMHVYGTQPVAHDQLASFSGHVPGMGFGAPLLHTIIHVTHTLYTRCTHTHTQHTPRSDTHNSCRNPGPGVEWFQRVNPDHGYQAFVVTPKSFVTLLYPSTCVH